MNRLSTVTYCGTTITGTSYVYDKNGNPLQVLNENATVTYIYDFRNRVLNETYAVNTATRTVVDLGCSGSGGSITRTGGVAKTYTVATTYNGELVNTIAYPTIYAWNPDITIKYSYDGLGRILNVLNVSTSVYFAQLTYSKADQVVGVQYGNGLIGNYTYDKLSRPNIITLKNPSTNNVMMSLTYSYNNTGTVSSLVGQVNSATVNEQYKYDPLQRLVNSTVTNGGGKTAFWYQYDNVGNRMAQGINGTVTNYTYNQANNELVSSSSPGTSTAYSYDQDGRLLNKNVTTTGTVRWYYTWDQAGDLLKVTNSTGQALYAYDGGGRRVEAVESGPVWYFAYAGTEVLYKNRLNTYNCAYIFASGLRIANFANGSTYYYHADALGSIRMITYPNAAVAYTNGYQPYGQYTGTLTGNLGKWAIDKFDGKPFSISTGLYYDYQRWYDPSIGRFISPDPLAGHRAYPQSLNRYLYVLDSPTSNIDPAGRDCFSSLTDFGGCAGGFLETLGPENGIINIGEKLTGVNTDQLVSSTLGPTAGQVYEGSRILSGGAFLASGIVAAGALVAPLIGIGTAGGTATTVITTVTAGCTEAEQGCAQGVTDLLASGGNGATNELVNTADFWNTVDSSNLWSKATFDTPLDSLAWHLAKHALGLSGEEYTQDAVNLKDALWDQGVPWTLRTGEMGWKIESDFGAGQGGIYDLAGLIVTFWYGPPGL
jgi:RHS repeat-associated protein